MVNPDDASILAQKIEEMLINKNLHSSFINAGKKIVREKFAADKQFSLFFKKLETIISDSN